MNGERENPLSDSQGQVTKSDVRGLSRLLLALSPEHLYLRKTGQKT